MKSKELREQRAATAKEMERMVLTAKSENRPLNSQEQEAFDKMHSDCSTWLSEAEGYERIESFEKQQLDDLKTTSRPNKPQVNTVEHFRQQDADKALKGWLCSRVNSQAGLSHIASENANTAERYGFHYNTDRISLTFADQSSITNNLGAEFVPTTLANFVYRELLPPSNIRQIARMLRTSTGETFKIPVSTDVAEAVLIAQNAQDAQGDIPTAEKDLRSYCYTTKRVNVPVEWLRDSQFPVLQFVGEEFGRRYARGTNKALVQGSGSSQPQGYNKAPSATTVTTSVKYEDMLALRYSIPIAYRESPDFAWRVSDAALQSLQGEVDGIGRPLWNPSIAPEQADTLMGDPVYVDPYLDDLSDPGNVVVVAGDWSRFLIREVGTFDVWDIRVVDYRQIALVGFGFLDSLLLSDIALRSITVAGS